MSRNSVLCSLLHPACLHSFPVSHFLVPENLPTESDQERHHVILILSNVFVEQKKVIVQLYKHTHLTSVHSCLHFCANLIRKTVLVTVLTGTARKSFQFYNGSVITLLIIFMSTKQILEKVSIQNNNIPAVVYCSQFSEHLLFFI